MSRRRRQMREEDVDSKSLDTISSGALARLIRILHRCGVSRERILAGAEAALGTLPNEVASHTAPLAPELPAAPHVLTIWHDEPRFTDASGHPLPLPLSSTTSPSFRALVRQVDARLDAKIVLQYLMRSGAVKRHRARYFAVKRIVILRGMSGPRDFRQLRSVDAMLHTVEHNLLPEQDAPGWLERFAENMSFPVSELPGFATFLERQTEEYLKRIDNYMHDVEASRLAGTPTIRLGVGMYRFQDEVPPAVGDAPTAPSKGRRRRTDSR